MDKFKAPIDKSKAINYLVSDETGLRLRDTWIEAGGAYNCKSWAAEWGCELNYEAGTKNGERKDYIFASVEQSNDPDSVCKTVLSASILPEAKDASDHQAVAATVALAKM